MLKDLAVGATAIQSVMLDDENDALILLKPMAPEGVKVYNPCFDVTDSELITAIITQNGIAYPPYNESLPSMYNSSK